MAAPSLPVSLADIEAAAARLDGVAVRTPLLRLPSTARSTSSRRASSAPARSSSAAPSTRSRRRPFAAIERGVVADSSGNHAQGVAAAAALLGVPATIVMPENAAPSRSRAPRRSAPRSSAAPTRARSASAWRPRSATTRSLEYIPPFDDARIIAGQGTVGLEIARDLPEVATVVVCVGGGGLISGVATAVKALCPDARVIGVEPELAADAQESLREGRIVSWPAADVTRTICDGVRTQALGELTFATISALVDEIVTVSEEAVLEAMRWLALEAKLARRADGGADAGGTPNGRVAPDGPTCSWCPGGNVDPALAAAVLAGELA